MRFLLSTMAMLIVTAGVRADEAGKLVLLLVEVGCFRAKGRNGRLEDAFDSRDLVDCQAEIALEIGVPPPGETKRLCVNGSG